MRSSVDGALQLEDHLAVAHADGLEAQLRRLGLEPHERQQIRHRLRRRAEAVGHLRGDGLHLLRLLQVRQPLVEAAF